VRSAAHQQRQHQRAGQHRHHAGPAGAAPHHAGGRANHAGTEVVEEQVQAEASALLLVARRPTQLLATEWVAKKP
jgi:hypothetical protein